MKQNFRFLLLIELFFLVSCQKQQGEIIRTENQSGSVVLTISSSRYVIADPWLIEIEAVIEGVPQGVNTMAEVVTDQVTYENVSFSWISEGVCIITVKQKNGTEVVIPAYVAL